jgi:hypothetical protein
VAEAVAVQTLTAHLVKTVQVVAVAEEEFFQEL